MISRYNPSNGKFVADRAGLYYFHQYWVANSNNNQFLHMRKNGAVQCRSQGNTGSGTDLNAPSCSCVLELAPTDEVYVTGSTGSNLGSFVDTGFTGFLIRPYI